LGRHSYQQAIAQRIGVGSAAVNKRTHWSAPVGFKVGQAVIARFPNYSYWPAMVLDPLTAPPKTQGMCEFGFLLGEEGESARLFGGRVARWFCGGARAWGFHSYWPAMVLDPLTAPPKTQGTRVKGAYLVKSIPTGEMDESSGGTQRLMASGDRGDWGDIRISKPLLNGSVLDPLTAPPKTQGTRVKGAYLVKSIPTGADQCVTSRPAGPSG
jgi:hypothetical protein